MGTGLPVTLFFRIYQFDASRDYDPALKLARITASVLAINSADDERNPHETGLLEKGVAQ